MKNARLFRGRSGETNRGIRAFAKISSSTSFFYAVSRGVWLARNEAMKSVRLVSQVARDLQYF